MSRQIEIDRLVDGVRSLLGSKARRVKLETLLRNKSVLGKLPFGVDGILKAGDRYYLVQVMDVYPLPERVIRAKRLLGNKTAIIIVACASDEATGVKVASHLADKVCEQGFGLAVALPDGVAGIFPPGYSRPIRAATVREYGHISRKLLDALDQTVGFSSYFAECVHRFTDNYRALTASGAPTFDDETAVLFKFATDLAEGDRRVFCPVGQLHILKEWERAHADPNGRDHVFHTFNNLILGALLLVGFLKDRRTISPESFVADTGNVAKLAPWELIWLFTCLFHDPGYVAEKLGATFNFNVGARGLFEPEMEIPEVLAHKLEAAWDTYWAPARHDLQTLFQQLTGTWTSIRSDSSIWQKFDDALKLAYYKVDGGKGLHSLLSGLRLIDQCSVPPGGVSHADYDKRVTQDTSVIAALCMLFHDDRCRIIFERQGIPRISFELLPYAAALMFVDALQEDRRSIDDIDFPAEGFLGDLNVDVGAGTVSVAVWLGEIPLRYWPYKIAEMRSVLKWINESSRTHFSIDYETPMRIKFS